MGSPNTQARDGRVEESQQAKKMGAVGDQVKLDPSKSLMMMSATWMFGDWKESHRQMLQNLQHH